MPVFYTVLKLQIQWQYISNIFGIQVPALEMQINLMTIHLERILGLRHQYFLAKRLLHVLSLKMTMRAN